MKCKECGGEINTKKYKNISFCSHNCYMKNYRKGRPVLVKKCAFCNNEFQTKSIQKIYCSKGCKLKKTYRFESQKKSYKKWSQSGKGKKTLKNWRQTSESFKAFLIRRENNPRYIAYRKIYVKSDARKISSTLCRHKRRELAANSNDNTITQQYFILSEDISREFWRKKGYTNQDLHFEHFVPLAKGGMHSITNTYHLPAELNLKKNTKNPKKFFESIEKGLYNEIIDLIKFINDEYNSFQEQEAS